MVNIFKSEQVREIDQYTIQNEPIASIDLMERASKAVTHRISKEFDKNTKFIVFAGPGNNGGDALAVSRLLAEEEYPVETYVLKIKEPAGDPKINLDRLEKQKKVKVHFISKVKEFPKLNEGEIIIDGLFGSGLTKPVSGIAGELITHLNNTGNKIIAIDFPSGLFGEDNSQNTGAIIEADYTFKFQFPSLSFMFPEIEKYLGKWEILPIGLHQDALNYTGTVWHYVTRDFIKSKLKKREKFAHKGIFGHALLISGSYGKMGAAVLASEACLRAGVGLLTTHIPGKGYSIIQTAVPEAMVSIDKSKTVFATVPLLDEFTAIGIGPGIGIKIKTIKAVTELLNSLKKPIVFDADGLNILAHNKELLQLLHDNTILTPHPKEFERLAGSSENSFEELKLAINFAVNNKITLVLKRANTVIISPEGKCYFNSTGNPGMATAGSGDSLTGIILSLLAQGYDTLLASIIGVYIHGLAGDLAAEDISEYALTAGDITDYLGQAFLELE